MKIAHMFLIPPSDSASTFKERYDETIRIIEISRGRGFAGIWFAEHHFSDYGYCPNPLMLMQEASRIAPEMRIGSAIVILPLWNPLRLAEDIALLDVLSGGRVDLGIGRGYQSYEFSRLGADLANSRDAFNESLQILKDAWTKDDFEHKGRFWQFEKASVFPKPLQQPIPIWMAATSPPSIRSALARGYHVMTGTGGVFEELEQRNAFIDSILKSLGRPLDEVERSTSRFAFCSNSRAEIDLFTDRCRDQVRFSRALSSGAMPVAGKLAPLAYPGEPEIETWRRRLIIGTPEECINQITQLANVGMTYVHALFDVGLPHDIQMRSVKLFCDEVMPVVESIKTRRDQHEVTERKARAYLNRTEYYQGV